MRLRTLVVVPLALSVPLGGCDKKTENAATAASAAPAPASPDARTVAAKIRQFYPSDCDASAASWKWAKCHDETKGFYALLTCATSARDQAEAAAGRMPAATKTNPETPCADSIEAQSTAFVRNTAAYLDDVVRWLTAHRFALAGPLHTGSLQDVDDDKLKADMPHDYDAKYGGDGADGQSLSFGWVTDLACAKSLFRCGTEDDPSHKLTYVECGVQAAAVRLGVECGSSSPYHHPDGKPYCPSMICDLNDPGAWLYDRATGNRIR